MSAIISYLKIIDEMLELYMTKWFRKYLRKKTISVHNTPLEKSLRLVVEKKHSLSLWRLYQSLEIITKNSDKTPYVLELCEYLKSRSFLEKCLLSSSFLLQLKWLIDIHALWDKRHKGFLSKKDTIKARKIIIWDFTDTASILYSLAESQTTT